MEQGEDVSGHGEVVCAPPRRIREPARERRGDEQRGQQIETQGAKSDLERPIAAEERDRDLPGREADHGVNNKAPDVADGEGDSED
jgi:hypothetical protein